MSKKHSHRRKPLLIIVAIILMLLSVGSLIIFTLFKVGPHYLDKVTGKYLTFGNAETKFSIDYPADWVPWLEERWNTKIINFQFASNDKRRITIDVYSHDNFNAFIRGNDIKNKILNRETVKEPYTEISGVYQETKLILSEYDTTQSNVKGYLLRSFSKFDHTGKILDEFQEEYPQIFFVTEEFIYVLGNDDWNYPNRSFADFESVFYQMANSFRYVPQQKDFVDIKPLNLTHTVSVDGFSLRYQKLWLMSKQNCWPDNDSVTFNCEIMLRTMQNESLYFRTFGDVNKDLLVWLRERAEKAGLNKKYEAYDGEIDGQGLIFDQRILNDPILYDVSKEILIYFKCGNNVVEGLYYTTGETHPESVRDILNSIKCEYNDGNTSIPEINRTVFDTDLSIFEYRHWPVYINNLAGYAVAYPEESQPMTTAPGVGLVAAEPTSEQVDVGSEVSIMTARFPLPESEYSDWVKTEATEVHPSADHYQKFDDQGNLTQEFYLFYNERTKRYIQLFIKKKNQQTDGIVRSFAFLAN